MKMGFRIKKILFLKSITFLCLLLQCKFLQIQCADSNYIRELLGNNKIIPDVLDVAPKNDIKIIYGENAVNFGNILLPVDVFNKPTDMDWPIENQQYYSLIMTDPDSPSRSAPKNREWLHWLVGNIPELRIKLGETLAEYIGAIHPKGNGLHRYVFTVYKQPEKVNFTELILDSRPSDVMRANFSTLDFARRYHFGEPLAANFFVVNWGK